MEARALRGEVEGLRGQAAGAGKAMPGTRGTMLRAIRARYGRPDVQATGSEDAGRPGEEEEVEEGGVVVAR